MSLSKFSYAERLEISLIMLTDYERDEAEFAAYNPVRFTSTWKTDWNNAILAARGTASDENTVDLGTDLTARQEDVMNEVRKNYQRHIKPFIEDAFVDDAPGLMNAFGVDDYDEARKSVSRMILFLDNLKTRCDLYASQLTAVGINPAKVALITTHLNSLQDSFRSKNSFTGERSIATSNRADVFETMDKFAQQTARAGKNIYELDSPRYNRYVIFGSSSTDSKAEEIVVAGGETVILFEGKLDADSGFRFNSEGPAKVAVFVSNSTNDATPSNALYLQPDGNDVRALANELLLGAGTYGGLVIRNDGSAEVKLTVQLLKVVHDA